MTEGWRETDARAKLNLLLRIYPRAADGYHPLETIFCRTDFADRVRLRILSQPGVTLRVSGPEPAPAGPENLAARAAALFLERSGAGVGAEIELQKRIPPGSGLGGGSSDAAAVLRLLDAALDSPLPREQLLSLAARLGADVTFFVTDTPLALAGGSGDRVLACPRLEPRPLLLLLPDLHVSTAEAYALWDERSGMSREAVAPESAGLSASMLSTWDDITALAGNDFEPVIFDRYPPLRSLKERLIETRPDISLLSGSGSALFAVYETERQRDEAALRLGETVENVRVISARGPW